MIKPSLRAAAMLRRDGQKTAAAWDLQWEDELGPEDEFTIPEAIVLAARMLRFL